MWCTSMFEGCSPLKHIQWVLGQSMRLKLKVGGGENWEAMTQCGVLVLVQAGEEEEEEKERDVERMFTALLRSIFTTFCHENLT